MTVEFLTKFLNKPDEEGWIKLKYVLKYLKGTSILDLALIVGDILVVKCWVGDSYIVHE